VKILIQLIMIDNNIKILYNKIKRSDRDE